MISTWFLFHIITKYQIKILKYMQKIYIKKNSYYSLSDMWKLIFKYTITDIKF